jgi:hypothetical protein
MKTRSMTTPVSPNRFERRGYSTWSGSRYWTDEAERLRGGAGAGGGATGATGAATATGAGSGGTGSGGGGATNGAGARVGRGGDHCAALGRDRLGARAAVGEEAGAGVIFGGAAERSG